MDSDVPVVFRNELRKRKQKPAPMSEIMSNPLLHPIPTKHGFQMSFASLIQEKGEELGRDGTAKLSAHWKKMLELGGVLASVNVVEQGRILFTTTEGHYLTKVQEFVLSQPETDFW